MTSQLTQRLLSSRGLLIVIRCDNKIDKIIIWYSPAAVSFTTARMMWENRASLHMISSDLTRQEVFCSAHSSLLRLSAPPKLRHCESEKWDVRWRDRSNKMINFTHWDHYVTCHVLSCVGINIEYNKHCSSNNTNITLPPVWLLTVGRHDILMSQISNTIRHSTVWILKLWIMTAKLSNWNIWPKTTWYTALWTWYLPNLSNNE